MSHQLYCEWPFETLYINSGTYSVCCPLWTQHEFEIKRRDVFTHEIWNHPEFERFRNKMLEQDFSSCEACPRFKSKELSTEIPKRLPGPKRIVLSDDRTCNLKCWTCREKRDTTHGSVDIRGILLRKYLPGVRLLSLLHSGEVFASTEYLDLLYTYPWASYKELKIELFTNGTLLPRHFHRCEEFFSKVTRVIISLDAGTESGYAIIRKGNWSNVIEALELICDAGIELWTNFTITGSNFREIPSFVSLSEQYGATRIELKKLQRWWQSQEDFELEAVHLPDHPYHEEYLALLKNISEHPALNKAHL